MEGSVRIQGSKNTVLPVMAAALLQRGTVCLRRCPKIADVRCMVEILKSVGAGIRWRGDCLLMDCRHVHTGEIPGAYADKMRSSIFFLGSLLPRCGRIAVSYPGGCTIGKRPVDLHLAVLKAMGARIWEDSRGFCALADQLHGCRYQFPKISVGATENAVMAAATARGESFFSNCAREPEIVHLCRFLKLAGADIRGEGTTEIRVRGVRKLHPAEFTVPADRIVAGTYLFIGAAVRGKISLEDAPAGELEAVLDVYQKMGGQYEVKSGTLVTDSSRIGTPVPYVETAAYPGFPTDLQSPLAAVCATLAGKSRIREKIFEDRFRAAVEMQKMGAAIRRDGNVLEISGGRLRGAGVCAWDLRGGAALVAAGLAAEGRTEILHPEYIDRGYEQLEKNITLLGGKISRICGSINA